MLAKTSRTATVSRTRRARDSAISTTPARKAGSARERVGSSPAASCCHQSASPVTRAARPPAWIIQAVAWYGRWR